MIEFRNVTKYYLTPTSRKVILDGLNLRLPAGSKVGLLGRNGAGKSTVLSMVAGTAAPISGEIRREGAILAREVFDVVAARLRAEYSWS